jgi:hypothetical protein
MFYCCRMPNGSAILKRRSGMDASWKDQNQRECWAKNSASGNAETRRVGEDQGHAEELTSDCGQVSAHTSAEAMR